MAFHGSSVAKIPAIQSQGAGIVVGIHLPGQVQLFGIILTNGALCRFPGAGQGGQQQRGQDRNDGDHHQKLNQGKSGPFHVEVISENVIARPPASTANSPSSVSSGIAPGW